DAEGEAGVDRVAAPRPRRANRSLDYPAASALLLAAGGPTSVASCAAMIVAADSNSSCCSPPFFTSAAITPTHPPDDMSGAATAPFEMSSPLRLWSRPVRYADAVTFSASRFKLPRRTASDGGYPWTRIGDSSTPSGSAIQITMPLASRTVAARSRSLGRPWMSATRARSPQSDAILLRLTTGSLTTGGAAITG